ncbi:MULTISPECIES: response regulator [Pseudomonas]|uniref:response regulator n=1 Tax=Pseudomonas TaxID=286 RepID=UPI0008637B5F|nr:MULTISPECIES: response regulator [Pseudomonas]MDD1989915.1 response regulator [Pseudomonas putida]MDG9892042.1 response regulator [Pseudomonas juntendi]QOH70613.1 response regulator [Pseudomonas putida]HDS1796981.1 response regulator [Pseudomonas putida]
MLRNILVAEDDEILRDLAVEFLASLPSVEVTECASADDAMRLLSGGLNVALVFSDVHMPGELDGLGLALEIWQRWPTLPVLLTSGDISPRAEELPANTTFLAKPWSLAALTSALQSRLPGLEAD